MKIINRFDPKIIKLLETNFKIVKPKPNEITIKREREVNLMQPFLYLWSGNLLPFIGSDDLSQIVGDVEFSLKAGLLGR